MSLIKRNYSRPLSLKTVLPADDSARLRALMIAQKWNPTKAGAFIDLSPSVIESALAGRSIRTYSADKIRGFLTQYEKEA